jgi:hypothetical protein
VANESGLDSAATRFEKNSYQDLSLVLAGRKPDYNGVGASDLGVFLGAVASPRVAIMAMMNLATSWGPTQIMGWQAIARGWKLADLSNLDTHFFRAVAILADFQKEYHLPVSAAAPGAVTPISGPANPNVWTPFFCCWNSGSPTGRTYDPNYAGNGCHRMALYEQLGEKP